MATIRKVQNEKWGPNCVAYSNRKFLLQWTIMCLVFPIFIVAISWSKDKGESPLQPMIGALVCLAIVSFPFALVWLAGFLVIRRNCYFISDTCFGFRDFFRERVIFFDQVTNLSFSPKGSVVVVQLQKMEPAYIPCVGYSDWFEGVVSKLPKAVLERSV